MNPWTCVLLISMAGMFGGVVNALLTDNKFIMPQLKNGILCPGFLSNVLIGTVSALLSWALYGSGASIELVKATATTRQDISLTLPALAGAFLVGMAGTKWLTNEVDKRLLKESVKEAAKKNISPAKCDEIMTQSPLQILEDIKHA